MRRIVSQIKTSTDEFRANQAFHRAQADELDRRLEVARAGGSEKARTLHTGRGKLLVRDRIERLLDPATPFLELSPLAAHEVYESALPAAGLVTGIGTIHGRQVMIVANDATVKGGTYHPLTVKKHLRAQEIAQENRLPVHLPRRQRRGLPASAGRGVPGPRPLRAHLLQPGAHERDVDPADLGGARQLHRRRRLRPGDE